ncbi:plant cysteine oxidase 1-like [Malania oleifera]|uniref:plant cysteine oxidase 1-like n=1 Tax=Malania oleifera TaxID=397392 RepID=UPI0025AE5D03|nr:plant cysteine oxidase 1-like [Malania oleifera]
MTETGLVEHRRKVVRHVKKVIGKKRCRRNAKRAEPAAVPAELQKLFASCRDVFKGPGAVAPPDVVQALCRILDCMKPEDVGLSKDLIFFNPSGAVKGNPRVSYTTIYTCQNFSLCLFFLPANGVIPLHNHPGMTVFSKLLLGSMHIKAYDWVDPVLNSSDPCSHRRLARLKANRVFTAPCCTTVLYPSAGGNIHALTAITPCVVLDVLGPPYSKQEDRDCTYYTDIPCAKLSNGVTLIEKEEGECYGWLEETELPEESQMNIIEYLGPQIIETMS